MATIHKFGPFRLDADAEILFFGAEPTALGKRAVALLRLLLVRAGQPVSKDALIETAWPGLAIEDGNLTVQIAALRRVFEEAAGGASWIETLPRRGYRYVGPVVTPGDPRAEANPQASPVLALPDKPSIAVLPFSNLSGDPEQEYFADGMVDDIITGLTRFRSLFVIARNSSFTYKGRLIDIRQVGRELGVRYVLEGSMRRSGDRIRINGQLIDAVSGVHLWADRFEGAFADIFDLQDQVSMSVVGAVSPKLEEAEIQRAKRKPTENLDAYDCYLRAIDDLERISKKANENALRFLYKAIDLDPRFAAAYGAAARCYASRKSNNWMLDLAKETLETERLAYLATDLGKDDALVLSRAGFAIGHVLLKPQEGAALLERALTLNPHLATAWRYSGLLRVYLGESEVAIRHLVRAMRLSPLDPGLHSMQAAMALAHFIGGDYEAALVWADRARRENANFLPAHRNVAASAALAGRQDEARKAVARVLEIDPMSRISNLADHVPLARTKDLENYAEGLRRAGLPD
ncbi:winged helix-turn-helix domain-containing tetratricopeptide repeat protein [Bradyrhizobium erythrophlei]|uniref:winged helix-turn-helix domain-containing tetratricopeptide repeat protein n=1 Tax=Bradyrhizobium erythrophlei TaxID=1437360 RepID=UPI0035EC20BB